MTTLDLTLDENFLITVEKQPVLNNQLAEALSELSETPSKNLDDFSQFAKTAIESDIGYEQASIIQKLIHLLQKIDEFHKPG